MSELIKIVPRLGVVPDVVYTVIIWLSLFQGKSNF